MPEKPLGRRPPTDWRHLEKFPLTASFVEVLAEHPRPMAAGFNWYRELDTPTKDNQGFHWVARDGKLTRIRGGHCVCLKPAGISDAVSWHDFYDQGSEGACVGFGWSRAMSLFNRLRYDARWLYHEAQKIDEWPGEDYDGTSVRAGGEILRTVGHRQIYGTQGKTRPVGLSHGIAAYRWATSVDDVLEVLGMKGKDYVSFLNSWGRDYPRTVRMPASVLERLLLEEGEFAVPTDR